MWAHPRSESKGAKLEREAQPVVSPAPHPDLLDVVVGQRVMAQQGGFVRGQANRAARWRALQMLRLGMFHRSVIRSSRQARRCP